MWNFLKEKDHANSFRFGQSATRWNPQFYKLTSVSIDNNQPTYHFQQITDASSTTDFNFGTQYGSTGGSAIGYLHLHGHFQLQITTPPSGK